MDYRKYSRAEALRRRRRRSFQRACFFVLLLLFLMGLAAVITWIIEAIGGAGEDSQSQSQIGSSSSQISSSQTEDSGSSSTVSDGVVLPELGRVELSYFADAAFIGDSITVGWNDYKAAAALPDTNVIASIGATPPTGGVQWKEDDGTLYDPLERIVEANPSKLYLMFGANALVVEGDYVEDTLIESYGKFIDDLQSRLPDSVIYIQSILTPAATDESHAGLSAERIARVNERLKALAEEKGCWYLALDESLCTEDGLNAAYAAGDGLHLSKEGYMAWLEYLITHAAYDPENPYVGGIDPTA